MRHTDRMRVWSRLWQRLRIGAPASGSAAGSWSSAQGGLSPESLAPCDILVQVDNFESGGLENVVMDLNSSLMTAGYRVLLLVLGSRGPAVQRARDRGQTVICCGYSQEMHADLIERTQPKLVLAHYSVQGIEIWRRNGVPFVQVVHNVYVWFNARQRQAFAAAAALTTVCVAVSEAVKAYAVSSLGVPAEKCTVIHNGIDSALFRRRDRLEAGAGLRRQYGISSDAFVFLAVGAINQQKNHLGVVRAFAIAAGTCSNSRLVILGPCQDDGILKTLVSCLRKKGLSGRVVVCGAARSSDAHLAMADAFVSGSFFEGCQLSLLEAVVTEVPVVTTAVGIAPVFEGWKGIHLVEPPHDISTFSGPMRRLRSTPEFEQRLAEGMIATWRHPTRPSPSQTEVEAMDRACAYQRYVSLVADLIGQSPGSACS